MRSTSSSQKLDLGFIIDASFPFRQDFKLVKNFLNMLTKKFTINDDNVRVGIILFNNDASLEVALADFQSNSDIVDAVDRLEILSGILVLFSLVEKMTRIFMRNLDFGAWRSSSK